MIEHAPYFLLGVGAGGIRRLWHPNVLGILGLIFFLAFLSFVGDEKAMVIHSVALLGFAWMAWLWLDNLMQPDGALARSLRYLGQASMAIYLMHTIFTAAVRIGLLKVGTDELAIVLPVTVLAGLAFPLLALSVARKINATKLLGF